MNNQELESRLTEFSTKIVRIEKSIQKTKSGKHLFGQLIRSGTSVALNYGEAQSAESRKDFIHKMKVILKELREMYICLRIILNTDLCHKRSVIETILQENNELIAIFVSSIQTARKKL